MSFLNDIFNFILPPHCSVCGTPLEKKEKSICDKCWGSIQIITPPFCERCGKPSVDSVCNECIEHPHEFTRARALGEYKDVLRELLLLSKGARPKISIWKRLGVMLGKVLKNDEVLSKVEALIPVPLYPVVRRARGYNQSEILAQEVSNWTEIPKLTNVLFQTRPTKPQKSFALEKFSYEERREKRKLNIENAFRVGSSSRSSFDIKDKKLLLIDDVCTTGATLDECAKELYKAGANEIYALVVARASSPVA